MIAEMTDLEIRLRRLDDSVVAEMTNPEIRLRRLDDSVVEEMKNPEIRLRRLDDYFRRLRNRSSDSVSLMEPSLICDCDTCRAYDELKLFTSEELLEKENVSNNVHPYLCDVVQEEPRNTSIKEATVCDVGVQANLLKNNFSCEHCSSKFNNENYLRHHQKVHFVKYKRPTCPAAYSNQNEYQNYILAPKSRRLSECNDCKAGFTNKKKLIEHLEDHMKKQRMSSGKKVHLFRWSEGAPQRQSTSSKLQCEVCYRLCGNAGSLTWHRAIHNRKQNKFPYSCSVCEARFALHKYLVLHEQYSHK